MSRLTYALCAYGLPHTMGYLKTVSGESAANPWSPLDLMNAAVDLNLAGVEFPMSALVPSFDGALVQVNPTAKGAFDTVHELKIRGLRIIADYGMILDNTPDHLRSYMKTAATAGARVVRCTLSHILCGDRRKVEGGWKHYMDRLVSHLQDTLPYAQDLGLSLAVENHQDAGSRDLVQLYERSGESIAFGVTLDTGNPLAVGEDPVEFTRNIAPLIRHIHLKDYIVVNAPEGYRLVRCANGDGVIDFAGILAIAAKDRPDILPSIEIAAQAARTIPIYEETWWDCYKPVPVREFLPVLRLLRHRGLPENCPWKSKWENGGKSEEVLTEEWDVVSRSVDYFKSLEI